MGAFGSFIGSLVAGKNSVQLIGDIFQVRRSRETNSDGGDDDDDDDVISGGYNVSPPSSTRVTPANDTK